jgi:uncharacterized membrane protein
VATSTQPLPTSRVTSSRSRSKIILWTVMALTAISVIFSTEIPILRDIPGFNHTYRLQLISDRFLLIPHALGGLTALLAGPLQFSTRLRRKHLRFHRILGRIYVGAVFVAVPCAIAIEWHRGLFVATVFQASLWFFCTLAALLTARNRQLVQHRQWMIRSYAMTFTFIMLRILNFWPAYLNINDQAFTLVDIIVSSMAVFLPSIAFNWRELTTSRA